jgi:lysophospholipase L1-like esterase
MLRTKYHIIASKAIPLVFFILLIIFIVAMKKPVQDEGSLPMGHTYLALGDSYTIGEQVDTKDNFPNQATAILKERGILFGAPQIIAQTGWTTDELQTGINKAELRKRYDLVTLLIGVNNEYRGRKVEEYALEFESLLKQAIQFAGNDIDHVIVLSIPDWGVTPFAAACLPDRQGRDKKQIAKEIDEYNSANELISGKYKVHYINVTESTRQGATDTSLLASDGLHPSGKEYAKWAKKVADFIQEKL